MEVEDEHGRSMRVGKWIDLPDDLGALQVKMLNPIQTINIVMSGGGPDLFFVHIEDTRGNPISAGEWFDGADGATRELVLRVPGGDVDCQTETDTDTAASLLLEASPATDDDDEDDDDDDPDFECASCGSTFGEPTDDGTLWRCTDCGTRHGTIKKKRVVRRATVTAVKRHKRLCHLCHLFHWSDEACPDWPRSGDQDWYLCKFCEMYHPPSMNCIDGTRAPMMRLRVDVRCLPSHLVPAEPTEPIQYKETASE